MSKPLFNGGMNVAIKIPKDRFKQTVAFYRDVLGFELEKEEGQAAGESYSFDFGPMTLWLDSVDESGETGAWLELQTDDLKAAEEYLPRQGVSFHDYLEKLPEGMKGHWIKSPAGTVHLVRGRESP